MTFWKEHVKPMRAELNRLFPKCFVAEGDKTRKKRALKIGIHMDIFERMPTTDQKTIRLAIFDYVQGRKYLSASFDGATRIDLDGKPSGLVTADHRRHLVRMNDERERKRRKDVEKVKEPIGDNRQASGSSS